MTEASLRELIAWHRACMPGSRRRTGPEVTETANRGFLAMGSTTYLLADGITEVPVELVVQRTPEGPRATFADTLILPCLAVRYGESPRTRPQAEHLWAAVARGLPKERAALEAIGLKGIVSTDADNTFQTFDELERFARTAVSRLERTRRGEDQPPRPFQ